LDFPKKPACGPYECHKHKKTCTPVQEALKFLTRYSLDTLRRISQFASQRQPCSVTVEVADARSFPFPDCDLVITSPPYVGLIDYHEQHRYAYELLGLNERRSDEIGASWRGNSAKAVAGYVDDMTVAFDNCSKALPRGGRMVVVVHDRRDLYESIANRLGFRIEYRLQRHVNRRTGRRAGDFFEDVIVWRK
jgi:hypothetical protein